MVVGGVVDVAPAPWPEAPVVPGLPVPAAPVAPLWLPPELPIALLGVAAVAVLLPVSVALDPVALHAAKDSVIMLPINRSRTMFMIVSLWVGAFIMDGQASEGNRKATVFCVGDSVQSREKQHDSP